MKNKKNKKFDSKMTNKTKSNNMTTSAKNKIDAKSNQNICDKCDDRFESNELQ